MGGQNNASLVWSIFTFYVFLFVILGLIGFDNYKASVTFTTPEDPSSVSFLTQISYFVHGIAFSITGLPIWANILLFLPIGITLFYIILSYFRGSS